MKIINHSNVDYIFQLGYGYWKSEVLFAGVEFDIFTLLSKGKLTSKDISKSIKANKRSTEMLLDALVSLALLGKQSNYYKNSEISNMYLVKGSPYYLGDSIHHFHNIMENWSMLMETVATGKPVSIKELPEDVDPHDLRDFITAMHNIASVRTEELCKKVNLKKSKTLLDVAGGPGTYAIALVKANPHLQATVFDLEQVTKLTQEFIKSAGLKDRVFTQAGNCLEDSLGKDKYDAILVSNLLHIYNPKNNIKILNKCWHALKKGGQIIIHEFVLDKTRTKPQFAALFSLNMLIGTQEGASYTESEYRTWLKSTGFKDINRIDLESNSTLIIGKK
ncbi:MAG TPA: class I SAM-dependent methyltransferase [Candidatus Wujingus californicus]|uniref:class I SAM-dependent methyltransferase n=1 Tax=Candidatus Wujingus californicus TaxID=3367618 RepID=UPI001DCFFC78|nr:methyltransferase domain-containing protein [Planctomycetota bacterium]MDO8131952.1 class I SAM-dependent methyltransferase [Candidatus Brocadiales bacterium]